MHERKQRQKNVCVKNILYINKYIEKIPEDIQNTSALFGGGHTPLVLDDTCVTLKDSLITTIIHEQPDQTEPATFASLLFWAFFNGSVFCFSRVCVHSFVEKIGTQK